MSNELNEAQRREKLDPLEDAKPLPWFITMTIGAFLMWGATYIVATDMTAPPEAGDGRTEVIADVTSSTSSVKVALDGSAIFQAKCVACHQATGQGVPSVFPPLASSEWVKGKPEVLVNILLHGINGKIHVKNNEYNGQMPQFKGILNDDEIAAVLTYIRSQWGNKADPVEGSLVKKIREATKERNKPYNGDEELSKI
jgi:mono/diheme cytochrome c family protein